MRKIAILGSTGSIGRSTLVVADRFPEKIEVVGLAGGRNLETLSRQVLRHRPRMVVIGDGEPSDDLLRACKESGSRLAKGSDGLAELASEDDIDTVVSAIVGAVGLEPTLTAVQAGKRIALANKEVLVMAGELVMKAAREHGAEILPVDSEHNAIFQCLEGNSRDSLKQILLCATGGPLWTRDREEFSSVSVEEALNHPRWNMGRKVSIDSATMMNKGLEMIEARWLFDLRPEQIRVLVHPQAIVHSLVEYVDGSVIAELSQADMEIPIQYCLSYPDRWADEQKHLDLTTVSPLEFFDPDVKKFPALGFARAALEAGGGVPVVLNAADEVAVEAFLSGEIGFTDIMDVVSEVLQKNMHEFSGSLESILVIDQWARAAAEDVLEKFRER